MTEQEFKVFLEAVARFDAQHTATPESARKALQSEGVLTESGEIADTYSKAKRKPDAT